MAAEKKKSTAPAAPAKQPKAAQAEDLGLRTYRALADCRVGHLRREGEVFNWPAFAECPDHLEEVDGGERSVDAEIAAAAEEESGAAQGATLADLGLGPAKSAADVTSGDMITS